MNLVVFGASGATGRHVVTLAAEAGHHVRAVVRAVSPAPVAGLRVEADVVDPASVAHAVRGADAVAVCLGISRRTRSPFAPLVSPPDLTSRAVAAIVAAMRDTGPRRIVHVSAFGPATAGRGSRGGGAPSSGSAMCATRSPIMAAARRSSRGRGWTGRRCGR